MEYGAELTRLEELVDKLLMKYSLLKADCHALQETLRQRDDECAELKIKVRDLSAEQHEVSGKVTGMLDRIEQWECEQVTAISGSSDEKSESPESSSCDDSGTTTF